MPGNPRDVVYSVKESVKKIFFSEEMCHPKAF